VRSRLYTEKLARMQLTAGPHAVNQSAVTNTKPQGDRYRAARRPRHRASYRTTGAARNTNITTNHENIRVSEITSFIYQPQLTTSKQQLTERFPYFEVVAMPYELRIVNHRSMVLLNTF